MLRVKFALLLFCVFHPNSSIILKINQPVDCMLDKIREFSEIQKYYLGSKGYQMHYLHYGEIDGFHKLQRDGDAYIFCSIDNKCILTVNLVARKLEGLVQTSMWFKSRKWWPFFKFSISEIKAEIKVLIWDFNSPGSATTRFKSFTIKRCADPDYEIIKIRRHKVLSSWIEYIILSEMKTMILEPLEERIKKAVNQANFTNCPLLQRKVIHYISDDSQETNRSVDRILNTIRYLLEVKYFDIGITIYPNYYFNYAKIRGFETVQRDGNASILCSTDKKCTLTVNLVVKGISGTVLKSYLYFWKNWKTFFKISIDEMKAEIIVFLEKNSSGSFDTRFKSFNVKKFTNLRYWVTNMGPFNIFATLGLGNIDSQIKTMILEPLEERIKRAVNGATFI